MAAGALAGAIVVVAIFVVQQFSPDFSMPESVVAAFTTLVSAGIAYWVRERAPARA